MNTLDLDYTNHRMSIHHEETIKNQTTTHATYHNLAAPNEHPYSYIHILLRIEHARTISVIVIPATGTHSEHVHDESVVNLSFES